MTPEFQPGMRVVVLAALLCGSTVAQETEPLAVIDWQELRDAGRLDAGEVVAEDGPHEGVLRVEHAGPGPVMLQIAEINEPGVTSQHYVLRGATRYEDVAGTGFLEMLNYLPDGQWFFSRTLAAVGPMQSISGTASWRPVELPASLGEDPGVSRPERLVINLHLEGPGTVYLSDLELLELARPWSPAGGVGTSAWWSDQTGGVIGGAAGTLLGVLLAVVGVLVGIGRGRAVVHVTLIAVAVMSGLSLLAGLAALSVGQPYAVTYPLLLLGLLGLALGIGGLVLARSLYQQHELRRMQALDA